MVRDLVKAERVVKAALEKKKAAEEELAKWEAMREQAESNAHLPGSSSSSQVMLTVISTALSRLAGALSKAEIELASAHTRHAHLRSLVLDP